MNTLAVLLGAAGLAAAQGSTLYPPPPGVPFPDTVYPYAVNERASAGAKFNQTSPPRYPSPWVDGSRAGADWTAAIAQAKAFVGELTLIEKINLTTGVGWEGDRCVGNSGGIPRLGFRSLCHQVIDV
jgi:beta-glucosidase